MSVSPISGAAYRDALALRDLTDAARGPHALQLLVADAVAALESAWHVPVVVERASPVVDVHQNYERLHYPPGGAARDSRYTRYVGAGRLLRTHTTALVPPLLERVGEAGYDDVLLACPGRVYRRDRIDRLSVGEPHQLDLWRVRRGRLGERDLVEMVAAIAGAVLPGRDYRLNRVEHPYTVGGREIEVADGGGWVEIGECGVAAPAVLAEAGLAPRAYGGLALGLGLDRILMVRKGIDDIRLLRSADPRVAAQMLDLATYRPVSRMPAVVRDLSLAVDAAVDAETLGDRVRAALAEDAAAVEAVELLAETPGAGLPPATRGRLGLRRGQKNCLVRIILRRLDATLTADEANRLRDRVYAALHEGDAHEWASTGD